MLLSIFNAMIHHELKGRRNRNDAENELTNDKRQSNTFSSYKELITYLKIEKITLNSIGAINNPVCLVFDFTLFRYL